MPGFQLQRLGLVMDPGPGNPLEAEGVLNPAAVRGRDGQLYLFPRLVARGNYSRIGIARVRFTAVYLGKAYTKAIDDPLLPPGEKGGLLSVPVNQRSSATPE